MKCIECIDLIIVFKLSTTCGGTIGKIERIFSNFSSFVIKLNTKGLNDQDSKANVRLVIDGYCSESERIAIRKATNNELSTTCGGEIEEMERIFSNFSSYVIKLMKNKEKTSFIDKFYDSFMFKILVIGNNFIIIIIILFVAIPRTFFYCRRKTVRKFGRRYSKTSSETSFIH